MRVFKGSRVNYASILLRDVVYAEADLARFQSHGIVGPSVQGSEALGLAFDRSAETDGAQ
jgi:hypothetical protein